MDKEELENNDTASVVHVYTVLHLADELRDFSKLILTKCSQYHLKMLSIKILTLALHPLDRFHRDVPTKAQFLPL